MHNDTNDTYICSQHLEAALLVQGIRTWVRSHSRQGPRELMMRDMMLRRRGSFYVTVGHREISPWIDSFDWTWCVPRSARARSHGSARTPPLRQDIRHAHDASPLSSLSSWLKYSLIVSVFRLDYCTQNKGGISLSTNMNLHIDSIKHTSMSWHCARRWWSLCTTSTFIQITCGLANCPCASEEVGNQPLITCVRRPHLIICTTIFEMSVTVMTIQISMLGRIAIVLATKDSSTQQWHVIDCYLLDLMHCRQQTCVHIDDSNLKNVHPYCAATQT